MMNISNKPSHLFAATVLGAVLCASFAPAHAGLLGGSASGGLTANGRVGGQLGADLRSVGPAARTISSGAQRTADGLRAQGAAQGAAQGSLPGGTQGSAIGSSSGRSTVLSGSAINTPTSSAADASLRKEAGTAQGTTSTQAGQSVDASADASLKTPTRTKR